MAIPIKNTIKTIPVWIILFTLIFSLFCSCSRQPQTLDTTPPANETENSTTESPAPESTAAQTTSGDFQYNDVEIREDEPGSGEAQCFGNYSDNMNFVKYKIIGQYSPEEAYKLTDYESFLYTGTLFKAKIVYDYLKNESVDIEINLAQTGTEKSQIANAPLYRIGDEYASEIIGLNGNSWAIAFSPFTSAVKEQDGVEYAYHILSKEIEFITPDGVNLDLGISKDEQYEYTSTSNNPVLYVHKLKMTELADFFRNDWTERGYTFTDFSKYVYAASY